MKKKFFILIILSIFNILNAMNPNIKDVLKEVKSNLDNRSLYEIVINRKKIFEKCLEYGESVEQCRYYILSQKNDLLFWDALEQSALSVGKNLYLESAKNAWTISKATFLSAEKRVFNTIKNVDKWRKNFNEFTTLSEAVITLADNTPELKANTEKFVSFTKKVIVKREIPSAEEIGAFLKVLDQLDKSIRAISKSNYGIKGDKLRAFSATIVKTIDDYTKYEKYIKYKNAILNSNFNEENIIFTSRDSYYLYWYYHILYSNVIYDIIDSMGEFVNIFDETFADYIKATSATLKYVPGISLAGVSDMTTFNNNFGRYVSVSINNYDKPIQDFIAHTTGNWKDDLKSFQAERAFYTKGNCLALQDGIVKYGQKCVNINKMVNLLNKLYGNNNAKKFVPYIIKRFSNIKFPWLRNIPYPITIDEKATIGLPFIGVLNNIKKSDINNYFIEIWGKNGTIVKKDLTQRDIYKINNSELLIGTGIQNNVKITFSKKNAFYNQEDKYFYYKCGVFKKDNNQIIYNFQPSSNGLLPLNQDGIISLNKDNELAINGNFAILPFTFNKLNYEGQVKLKKYLNKPYNNYSIEDKAYIAKYKSIYPMTLKLNSDYNNLIINKLSKPPFNLSKLTIKDKILKKEYIRYDTYIMAYYVLFNKYNNNHRLIKLKNLFDNYERIKNKNNNAAYALLKVMKNNRNIIHPIEVLFNSHVELLKNENKTKFEKTLHLLEKPLTLKAFFRKMSYLENYLKELEGDNK